MVAVHDHSGGSGQGTRALGGATGLASVTFADAPAPAAPTGTLTTVYTTGSRLAVISSGGTQVLLAIGGHEHTLTQAQLATAGFPNAQATAIAGGSLYVYRRDIPTLYTGSSSSTISTAITVGGSGSRAVFVGASVTITKATATNDVTLGLRVLREGTVLGTSEIAPVSDTFGNFHLQFSTLIIPPTGSQTYYLQVKGTSAGNLGTVAHFVGGGLFVIEMNA